MRLSSFISIHINCWYLSSWSSVCPHGCVGISSVTGSYSITLLIGRTCTLGARSLVCVLHKRIH